MKKALLTFTAALIHLTSFAETASTGEAIKPLWAKSPEQWSSTPPAPNTKISYYPKRWTKAGDIVYSRELNDKLSGLVLVDGRSGALLDTLPFPALPAGHYENQSTITPTLDGKFILATVTGPLEDKESKGTCVRLRVIDPAARKLKMVFEKKMAFDDPASASGSGPVTWSSQGCVQAYCFDNRVAVVTPYYMVEFDAASWKPLHGTRMKGGSLNQRILKTGVIWDQNNKKFFMANYGGSIREITAEESTGAYQAGSVPFNGWMEADKQLAKCVDGTVEFAQRKLDLALPSPANAVFAFPSDASCVLAIMCPEGNQAHCVVAMPKK